MNISTFFTLYLVSIPIFFLIDMLWLGIVASSFYRDRIGYLMEINWPAAVGFYLMYLVGLTLFVTYPSITNGTGWQSALLWGALFGFFTYATYDLTNYSTLKDWPLDMVLVDIIWGTVLAGSVAALTYLAYSVF